MLLHGMTRAFTRDVRILYILYTCTYCTYCTYCTCVQYILQYIYIYVVHVCNIYTSRPPTEPRARARADQAAGARRRPRHAHTDARAAGRDGERGSERTRERVPERERERERTRGRDRTREGEGESESERAIERACVWERKNERERTRERGRDRDRERGGGREEEGESTHRAGPELSEAHVGGYDRRVPPVSPEPLPPCTAGPAPLPSGLYGYLSPKQLSVCLPYLYPIYHPAYAAIYRLYSCFPPCICRPVLLSGYRSACRPFGPYGPSACLSTCLYPEDRSLYPSLSCLTVVIFKIGLYLSLP